MIIFGTKGVTGTMERGQFQCPRCGGHSYEKKRTRRFFTLYFIPLIPMGELSRWVECTACASTFDESLLGMGKERP